MQRRSLRWFLADLISISPKISDKGTQEPEQKGTPRRE